MVNLKIPRVADVKKSVASQIKELELELEALNDFTLARWAYLYEEWDELLHKKAMLRNKIKRLSRK